MIRKTKREKRGHEEAPAPGAAIELPPDSALPPLGSAGASSGDNSLSDVPGRADPRWILALLKAEPDGSVSDVELDRFMKELGFPPKED